MASQGDEKGGGLDCMTCSFRKFSLSQRTLHLGISTLYKVLYILKINLVGDRYFAEYCSDIHSSMYVKSSRRR